MWFCWSLGSLDEKTDEIIQNKHNILLARLINKRYGPYSNIFDLKISNF